MYKITDTDYQYATNIARWRYKSCSKNVSMDDLIQASIESLYTSLKTYDMNKGVKFTHYAYRGIHQALEVVINQEKENCHCDLYETYADPRCNERNILDYSLLTQAECDLWDDLNNSKMSVFEYAKYKEIPDSTLYAKIQCIKEKIIAATPKNGDRDFNLLEENSC